MQTLGNVGELLLILAVSGGAAGLAMFSLMWVTVRRVEDKRKAGKWLDRRGRPREEPEEPDYSLVRLDPKVLEMRAYQKPVDITKPLRAMTLPFIVTGLITLHGRKAVISMVMARERDGITRPAYRALRRRLKQAHGVTRVEWERHDEDGTVKDVKGSI